MMAAGARSGGAREEEIMETSTGSPPTRPAPGRPGSERGPSAGRSPKVRATRGWLRRVTPDITFVRTLIANLYLVGGDEEWALVDAGMPLSTSRILRAVTERFGREVPPRAIVLTHGHFDHVGAVRQLAERWDVPVYAHRLELPFLRGESPYPPPDPSVGGGLMSRVAPLYPRGPIDLGERLRPLPEDGAVPHMPGWRWVPTPGHTTGHVSLFRPADRVLLAGDAFITVEQESAIAVMTQRPQVAGPPAYYTTDWREAEASVRRLAALEPALALTGHGQPMGGEELRRGLARLTREFERVALPDHGRYLEEPAVTDEHGLVYVPPRQRGFPRGALLWGGLAALAVGAVLGVRSAARRSG